MHELTFGYQINNYQHCLQAATMLYADGYDEETIVVGLLHDVGFLACPDRHGAFAAELLGGYVSDENYWMLRHHQAFATLLPTHPDEPGRELPGHRWRDHPNAACGRTRSSGITTRTRSTHLTATCPLEFFEPMVRRIFSRSPKPLRLDS